MHTHMFKELLVARYAFGKAVDISQLADVVQKMVEAALDAGNRNKHYMVTEGEWNVRLCYSSEGTPDVILVNKVLNPSAKNSKVELHTRVGLKLAEKK